MLTNRTFRIVWVTAGRGVGVASTATADQIVSYSGDALQVYGGN